MMKIQLLLILSAAFNMANPLPIRISPACRQLAIKGFPFYGKESVTLSEMLNNHEKTGLGKDHLAQQKIIFQQQDYNDNGLLEVEEKFYEVIIGTGLLALLQISLFFLALNIAKQG